MKKLCKIPTVRISQEIVKPAGVCGAWPTSAFFVTDRSTEKAIEVSTPGEARKVAMQIAKEIHGRVYRGTLPVTWQQALSDIPRH